MIEDRPRVVKDYKWLKVLMGGEVLFKVKRSNPDSHDIINNFLGDKF